MQMNSPELGPSRKSFSQKVNAVGCSSLFVRVCIPLLEQPNMGSIVQAVHESEGNTNQEIRRVI